MATVDFIADNSSGILRINGKPVENCSEFNLRCLPDNIPIATVHLVMGIKPGETPSMASVEKARIEFMVRELSAITGAMREYIAVEQDSGDWLVHPVR